MSKKNKKKKVEPILSPVALTGILPGPLPEFKDLAQKAAKVHKSLKLKKPSALYFDFKRNKQAKKANILLVVDGKINVGELPFEVIHRQKQPMLEGYKNLIYARI